MPKRNTPRNLWLRKATALRTATRYKSGKTKQVLVESSQNANVIAGNLSTEVFRVDLSKLVSKYIGETEKNLQAVFKEAESQGAVLLIDEADAVFGKRTEVKDAHDKYAMQSGPILKRLLKSYSGITIIGLKKCDK